jgi:hypothetical protein
MDDRWLIENMLAVYAGLEMLEKLMNLKENGSRLLLLLGLSEAYNVSLTQQLTTQFGDL